MIKNQVLTAVIGSLLLVGGVAVAQKPVRNVSGGRHPKLLELYGTGIRGHSACKIGSITLPVDYAGPQGVFVGLDQVNVRLPKALRGSGNVTVLLTVDGQTANAVNLTFK